MRCSVWISVNDFFFFCSAFRFFFYYYFYYHYHYYFQYRWENTAKPVSWHPVVGIYISVGICIGTTSQKLKTRVSHFYRPGQSEIYCSWTDQRHSYAFSIVSKPWCGLCPSRGDCTGRQNAKDYSELFFSWFFFFSNTIQRFAKYLCTERSFLFSSSLPPFVSPPSGMRLAYLRISIDVYIYTLYMIEILFLNKCTQQH